MPTIPAGPIAVDPTAETTTGAAVIGPTAAAPSPTPRVKPMQIRMAISKVKEAAYSGKPDCHIHPVITPTPPSQLKTATR